MLYTLKRKCHNFIQNFTYLEVSQKKLNKILTKLKEKSEKTLDKNTHIFRKKYRKNTEKTNVRKHTQNFQYIFKTPIFTISIRKR